MYVLQSTVKGKPGYSSSWEYRQNSKSWEISGVILLEAEKKTVEVSQEFSLKKSKILIGGKEKQGIPLRGPA